MSGTTTRLPTRPSLFRRFVRWVVLRQLRAHERNLALVVKTLERHTSDDRLELNRLNRMGNKNLILRSRFEHEIQELADQRQQLARVSAEIERVEAGA